MTAAPAPALQVSPDDSEASETVGFVGPIYDVVSRRWETLPDRTVADLCRIDSYPVALTAAVAVLHGAQALVLPSPYRPNVQQVVWLLDDIPDTLTKVVPTDRQPSPGQRGLIAGTTCSVGDESDWAWGQEGEPDGSERSDMLLFGLRRAAVYQHTLDDCLTIATTRPPMWRSYVEVGLRLWWQRALAQGHTPDTARLLLSLSADPPTLAHVTDWPSSNTTGTDQSSNDLIVDPRVVVPQV